jgi:hypothetical protein
VPIPLEQLRISLDVSSGRTQRSPGAVLLKMIANIPFIVIASTCTN